MQAQQSAAQTPLLTEQVLAELKQILKKTVDLTLLPILVIDTRCVYVWGWGVAFVCTNLIRATYY